MTNTLSSNFSEVAGDYSRAQLGANPPDGWFVVWTRSAGIFPFHSSNIDSMDAKIG